jgi:hypothetical protein
LCSREEKIYTGVIEFSSSLELEVLSNVLKGGMSDDDDDDDDNNNIKT